MDSMKDYLNMLELIPQPAFAVAEGRIIICNRQATACLLEPGIPVSRLMRTGQEEYEALGEGYLSLRLNINDVLWDATVTRLEEIDLFRLEENSIPSELKAMSLMANQLRPSIGNLTLLTERNLSGNQKAAFRQELSRIQRLLNNTSNTEHCLSAEPYALEDCDVCAILREVTEEAATLLQHTGLTLQTDLPAHPVLTAVDEHSLRQAVYNLLSNAAKFSPPGGTILCKVTLSSRNLRISISDQGDGIPTGLHANLFTRYTRQPAIEEGRQNLGLGLALVRAVAAQHSGTVLVDAPECKGTRVTLTLALQKQTVSVMRAPDMTKIVPAIDEGLIMLSDVLPQKLYNQ